MFRRILYPTDFSTAAKAELIVVEGIPFQEIVKTAKDKRVSLIVMGSHGEHGIVERVISSTTARVLRESPVPVLVIRPRGNRTEGKK